MKDIALPIISWLIFFVAGASYAQPAADDFLIIHSGPGLSLHKEMFMLPVTVSDKYDGAQTEAVFQISAKHRLFDTRFYFAYTQVSFWQAYDHDNSAPFRETNYNPELFYRFKPFALGPAAVGVSAGFEHESNGQRPPISRSWNLIYLAAYYHRGNLLFYLKHRYRIPEDKKAYPVAAVGDDNPDITDYLGYDDFHCYFRFWSDHYLHLMIRGNVSTGRGGVVLTYSMRVPGSKRSSFCIRISHGYGESMVDYRESLSRVGFGVMFN
jgi:phospholipase A1